jgi:hypothetical protein
MKSIGILEVFGKGRIDYNSISKAEIKDNYKYLF